MSDNDDFSLSSHRGFAEEDVDQNKNYIDGINIRAIRFKGGEEVVCGIHSDDLDWTIKSVVIIHQPMVIDAFGKMQPWSSIGNQYAYEISTDLIRSLYEIRARVSDQWNKAAADQYASFLRDDLLDPNLSDEEREEIEQELAAMAEDEQEEEPMKFGYMPVSETRH